MVLINEIKVSLKHSAADLKAKAAQILGVSADEIKEVIPKKRSLDARKKDDIHYSYSCMVSFLSKETETKVLHKKNTKAVAYEPKVYTYVPSGREKLLHRPVVIGAGPAGLFCAYRLALDGYAPILLERGASVEERTADVEKFWNSNELNTESNVSFGEGGAGTFSDGKLNTGVKETSGRISYMLDTFVRFGAPEEIAYINKPHIGTDCLKKVIVNMRKELIRLGATVRFHAKVTELVIENGALTGVRLGEEFIPCEACVLAVGHSARDTFAMLNRKNLYMTPKAFAVGVRIEHKQDTINRAQYKDAAEFLPAADYKLTYTAKNGRGIYSFCMCPGGFVVNASSETGGICVNGMSNHGRDEENANSAMIVTVTPQDFCKDSSDVLGGIEFQRQLERAAYRTGKGNIPVQLFGDLCNRRASVTIGKIKPNTKGAYTLSNLWDCLPNYIAETLVEGIGDFDRKIPGFADEEAVLLGVEARTSSPVRMERDEHMESNIRGLYPCGEGAGYAGGITSAAVDGIKVYEKLAERYAPFAL